MHVCGMKSLVFLWYKHRKMMVYCEHECASGTSRTWQPLTVEALFRR
jgi:hypothetical protein